MNWNHESWSEAWSKAVKVTPDNKRREHTAPLLIKVYKDTINRVKAGGYDLHGTWVDLKLNPDIEAQTIFYDGPINEIDTTDRSCKTIVSVVPVDCLKLAREIAISRGADKVCVLNLASYAVPGGGVYGGAGAQEEYLFRCSDYYRSLYQYGRYASEYGLTPHPIHRYPLHRRYGAVFSRGVTVFRDTQADGYRLLQTPFKVNMIAIAAHRNPPTVEMSDGEKRFTPTEEEYMFHKARTILRIAHANGQKALILGALGCGAFHNPPKHVAEIFKTVINEPEFTGLFDYIYFAIINDHNSNYNYEAFESVFNNELYEESDKSIIIKALKATCRSGIDNVISALNNNGFFEAPGSKYRHSNYKGGLAEHSLAVYKCAIDLKTKHPETFGQISKESIALTALLHDICKADVYFINHNGLPDKSMRKFPIGHGEKSVIMLLRLGLDLSEEEMLAIRWHMKTHTFKEKSVDAENYNAAIRSSGMNLIKLIQDADGMAAKSNSLKGSIKK